MADLNFVQGDACRLPFGNETFDAIINVEASHCYPSLPHFFHEVARVLCPQGAFLYADFRFRESTSAWDGMISAAPLEVRQSRSINQEVLRGMELNSTRSMGLSAAHLPRCLQGLGRDFAGVKGSWIYAGPNPGIFPTGRTRSISIAEVGACVDGPRPAGRREDVSRCRAVAAPTPLDIPSLPYCPKASRSVW